MDVATIALSGLRAAGKQLETAAANTANATTPGFKQLDVQQTAEKSGGVRTDIVQTDQDVSLDEQVVKGNIATYTFAANLKVLKKQQENERSLLDIKA